MNRAAWMWMQASVALVRSAAVRLRDDAPVPEPFSGLYYVDKPAPTAEAIAQGSG